MKEQQHGRAGVTVKVIGVGQGGCSAVDRMISASLRGVDLVAVDTDLQVLDRCQAGAKVLIGRKETRGLGAGGDWNRGREAALEGQSQIAEAVEGAAVVFVVAGMGCGTGTGSAGVIAEVARSSGALTVGVVTRPFRFEGRVRNQTAEAGLSPLRESADAVVVVLNDRLSQVVERRTTLQEAFLIVADVLRQGVQGITDLLAGGLKVADLQMVMARSGDAVLGIGHSAAEGRAELAARQAATCPLFGASIGHARGLVINVTAGPDAGPRERDAAVELVRTEAAPDAAVVSGTVTDPRMRGEMKVTIIATGVSSGRPPLQEPPAPGSEPPDPSGVPARPLPPYPPPATSAAIERTG